MITYQKVTELQELVIEQHNQMQDIIKILNDWAKEMEAAGRKNDVHSE